MLSELCVRRPVSATMLVMSLVVLGTFSFRGLGVDLFPKADPATVSVTLLLPGASPDEMSTTVVEPMEQAISGVSGIDELSARMAEGRAKAQLLADASLFILPSHSENFGLVVAEALMAEVPVIATHGTPWRLLDEESCGWWIAMERSELSRVLRAAMATPIDELRAMGVRGRQAAESRFGWPQIAREMADVYDWILGGGRAPACIDLR